MSRCLRPTRCCSTSKRVPRRLKREFAPLFKKIAASSSRECRHRFQSRVAFLGVVASLSTRRSSIDDSVLPSPPLKKMRVHQEMERIVVRGGGGLACGVLSLIFEFAADPSVRSVTIGIVEQGDED